MGQTLLQQVRLASGLNIIAGLWLVMAPYGFGFHLLNPPFWNSVVVGALVALVAIIRLMTPFRYPEIAWINVALGAWLMVSPFLFGFAGLTAALWNSLLGGLFVIVMALWSRLAGGRGVDLLR